MGFFVTLILYAVLFVLSELLRPKPDLENAKPAGLGDFQFPTATEDRYIPLIWGTIQQKGPNVVWYGDFYQEPIKEKVRTGLFSREEVIRGFRYHLGVQMALCRGGRYPVDELVSVRINNIDVPIGGPIAGGGSFTIDCPELFGGEELGSGGIGGTLVFYDGDDPQGVSTYLSSYQAVLGQTPRYNGTCYVAPETERIYLGNATNIKPWLFELRRLPNPLGLPTATNELNGGNDLNPMSMIYDVLTDTEWGLGESASTIDTSNFTSAATTLKDEGNGISYLLDRPTDARELIRIIEEQIDGVIYQDPADGLWKINLIRDDYDVNLLDVMDESNVVSLNTFSRGSWEDTTNVVNIQFNDREDSYKDTTAKAQDAANIRTLQGRVVQTQQRFPGVKNRTLANFVAWRQLRTLSYPLAKATVTVDRRFSRVVPGDVVAFSWDALGISLLAMRVQRVRVGKLDAGTVRIDLVQDVFTAAPPSFGDPPSTLWELPSDTLAAFASNRQTAFEAPRALCVRDPQSPAAAARVYASARQTGNEVGFRMRARPGAGTYETVQSAFGPLVRIGQLQGNLPIGSATPVTIQLTPGPDLQSTLESAFTDTTDPSPLGVDLVNLCVIDPGGSNEEYLLVTSAQTNGGAVQLNGVYRGVLDTVQRAHTAGDEVWLLFVFGAISETTFSETTAMDVKLLPFSATDEVEDGDATTISFTMDKRARRPYAPSRYTLNTVDWDSSVSLEGSGGAPETWGINTVLNRRDYRNLEEVQSLLNDAEVLDTSFPAANSTVHDIAVRVDPDGVNTLLFTEEDVAGDTVPILRLKILRFNAGAVPTRLRFSTTAKHTDAGEELSSRNPLVFDFDVTTSLTGFFEFGALDQDVTSATYTSTEAGTYSASLSSSFTSGDVEYRINAGSWTTLISAGGTSGSIPGVSVSDTIEVRHRSSDADALKQLTVTAPSAGQDAFAVFYT